MGAKEESECITMTRDRRAEVTEDIGVATEPRLSSIHYLCLLFLNAPLRRDPRKVSECLIVLNGFVTLSPTSTAKIRMALVKSGPC